MNILRLDNAALRIALEEGEAPDLAQLDIPGARRLVDALNALTYPIRDHALPEAESAAQAAFAKRDVEGVGAAFARADELAGRMAKYEALRDAVGEKHQELARPLAHALWAEANRRISEFNEDDSRQLAPLRQALADLERAVQPIARLGEVRKMRERELGEQYSRVAAETAPYAPEGVRADWVDVSPKDVAERLGAVLGKLGWVATLSRTS